MASERSPRAGLLLALAAAALGLGGCRRQAPAAAAPQPPVEAKAAVDRAVATTGDLITYTVTVDHDPAYAVEIPEAGAEIAGFRIVDVGREEPQQVAGRVVEKRWYKLRADLVGSYVLPPVTVTFRPAGGTGAQPATGGAQPAKAGAAAPAAGTEPAGGKSAPGANEAGADEAKAGEAAAGGSEAGGGKVETSEIFVEVESVLPAAGGATDIRDLKPLRQLRSGPPWMLIGGGAAALALLVAAGGWLVWRRRRRPAVPPPPPHEVAFAALDELRGTDFADAEAVRRYYFRLSEVVRAYVEGRFGLNATDLTTEEILLRLAGLAELAPEQRQHLAGFLTATDRVKFAAHEPAAGEIAEVYEQALSFVEATRPAEPEAQAGPEAEAKADAEAEAA
jgi:hypothetical protein